MAGGATLPRLLESSELEHLEIPFCFNGGEEVAVASVAGYAKLAFVVFSWFSLLVLLGSSPSFSYSTGTGTIEDDDLVDLGAVQMLLVSYIIGGSSIRVLSPLLLLLLLLIIQKLVGGRWGERTLMLLPPMM